MTTTSDKFIQGMGIVAQGEGMPRIAGQLFGLLVIEGGPFSFSDLAERLKVSRASISTNTRLLENLGIIERIGKTGHRQDYFQLTKAPYTRLLQGSVFRMSKAEQLVKEAQDSITQGQHQKRLKELRAFYHNMIESYQELIENVEEEND